MSRILKTTPELFQAVHRQEIHRACSKEFSYGFMFEGKMVSVVIALPYLEYRAMPRTADENKPSIAPKRALHKLIHTHYQPFCPEKTLFMAWGTVDFSHLKNAMYERLSLIVEEIGRQRGFTYSMGIASNISSQNISLNKLHYIPVFQLRYADFVHEGEQVFAGIKGTECIVVGLKKLLGPSL